MHDFKSNMIVKYNLRSSFVSLFGQFACVSDVAEIYKKDVHQVFFRYLELISVNECTSSR